MAVGHMHCREDAASAVQDVEREGRLLTVAQTVETQLRLDERRDGRLSNVLVPVDAAEDEDAYLGRVNARAVQALLGRFDPHRNGPAPE